jgi:hypothetical protein
MYNVCLASSFLFMAGTFLMLRADATVWATLWQSTICAAWFVWDIFFNLAEIKQVSQSAYKRYVAFKTVR